MVEVVRLRGADCWQVSYLVDGFRLTTTKGSLFYVKPIVEFTALIPPASNNQ